MSETTGAVQCHWFAGILFTAMAAAAVGSRTNRWQNPL